MGNAEDGCCEVVLTNGRVGTWSGSDEEPGPAAALVVGPGGSRTAAVICMGGLPTGSYTVRGFEPTEEVEA